MPAHLPVASVPWGVKTGGFLGFLAASLTPDPMKDSVSGRKVESNTAGCPTFSSNRHINAGTCVHHTYSQTHTHTLWTNYLNKRKRHLQEIILSV